MGELILCRSSIRTPRFLKRLHCMAVRIFQIFKPSGCPSRFCFQALRRLQRYLNIEDTFILLFNLTPLGRPCCRQTSPLPTQRHDCVKQQVQRNTEKMKPGQILRAWWSMLQSWSKVIFRVLGLSIIVAGLKSLRNVSVGKGYDEPTKIAIRQSRPVAFLRALIHIAPLSVALWEVILNWNNYYVGATIRNIAYYQFGAKVHEMAAQASLAAIVFTYVR